MARRGSIWDYACFERWAEKDFSDDRNDFKMFRYKGKLPISYLEKYGKIFCAIRPDYINIDFDLWKADFRIIDEFNGVTPAKFDIDKFEANCEYVYKRYVLNDENAIKPQL